MAQSSDPDVDAVLGSFDHPEAQHDSDAAAVLASYDAPTATAAPTAAQHAKGALDIVKQHPMTTSWGLLENAISGVTGGAGSLADAVTGSDPGAHDWAYRPRTEAGKAIAASGGQETAALGRVYDATAGTGPLAQTVKERLPETLGAIGTVTGVGGLAKGIAGLRSPGAAVPPTAAAAPAGELTASGAPRTAPFEPQDIPGSPGVKVDAEPVEGGLPPAANAERAKILQRVGLEHARDSALTGDAKSAATDYQLTKFDEPAGVAAKAQFDAEKQALAAHSEKIIAKTGGTAGLDEDAINTRGQTIARPFDALSDWFDTKRKALYGAADARAGGAPVTKLEGVDSLLKDPEFRNTLLAKDQGNLLSSIENQLGEFRKQSPSGFNVAGAENVRKWLNKIWTNDNKGAIGQVKDALDDDVMKGAGEDIYGPARALVQMKKQTLDNPSGINKLMEHDPQTPINRTTSFDKIPDTLQRLPPAQFDQVLKTLDTMPEELQPLAAEAKSEIKAHLVNKIHDAGTKTQGQWNSPGVDKVIKANSAKLQSAFADQPEVLGDLQDLRSAGKILQTNQSYPGAAAQAANALKRGFMSRAISHVATAAGGGIGGSIAGPLGAAGGAAVGETVGGKLGAQMSEKAAIRQWQSKLTKLSDVGK
jgi:hypothetical protein